jgi:membrane-associated phospholipid phosphatase
MNLARCGGVVVRKGTAGMSRRRFATLTLALACGTTVPASAARAQSNGSADTLHARKTLFTWRDAALAGGFTGLTFAMFPLDRSFAKRLQDSTTQANKFFKHASRGVEYIADPGSVVIGVGLYTVGRVGHWKEVADLGLHGTEAIALSASITDVIKILAGRARPFVSNDTSADDFRFGRGWRGGGDFQSFPSGHSTAAFTAASLVTSESRRWWPQGIWIVAPVMYGGATLVALSRMYHNKHWASDVAVGAAIGTFSGLKVERYNHSHPNNFIDRNLLHLSIAPGPFGGARLAWIANVP